MHEVRGVCATPLVHIGYAPAYGMPNDGWRMKKLGITTSSFLKKRIINKNVFFVYLCIQHILPNVVNVLLPTLCTE